MTNHENDEFDAGLAPEERDRGSNAPMGPQGTGVAWGAIFLLLFVAMLVVFAVQNTGNVAVEFLWFSGVFSLALVILVTVGVTILITEIAGLVYRGRRRRRLQNKPDRGRSD
ncbi:MAG: lipopolysaccharide assembly protein LapA domain-containing protein [Acidimicrobiia bacterium]